MQMTKVCPYGCGEFREDLGLLICRPAGTLTGARAREIITCSACFAGQGCLDANRFHDLTNVKKLDLHFDRMALIAAKETDVRKGRKPVKACFLVHNQVLYGTIRMYQALMADQGVEAHVGYEISELARVLGVDEKKLAHHGDAAAQ
jgi:hypothetical protein